MNKLKNKKCDFEYWHDDIKGEVLFCGASHMRFVKKKDLFSAYLEKINQNYVEFEIQEEQRNKLRAFYNAHLSVAEKISKKRFECALSQEESFIDKKHFNTDTEGNYYVSDDI